MRGDVSDEQPVGQGDYVVRSGDCLSSIAEAHGFTPQTLWDLPENAELKRERRDPNILLPGDRVTIPPRRPKAVAASTDCRHRFRRRGVPEVLRLQLKDADGEPRAGLDYELMVGGNYTHGRTDAEGWIRAWIPPGARNATVALGPAWAEVHEIFLGELDPLESWSGVVARLVSLGYLDLADDLDDSRRTHGALLSFQLVHGLEPTGDPDPDTLRRLAEQHGS